MLVKPSENPCCFLSEHTIFKHCLAAAHIVHVPPLEVKRCPADVGAAVHFAQKFVVGGEVIDERAGEAQALHQGAHLCLQSTASIHPGAKGLRDAKVFPQDNHVYLGTHDRS